MVFVVFEGVVIQGRWMEKVLEERWDLKGLRRECALAASCT